MMNCILLVLTILSFVYLAKILIEKDRVRACTAAAMLQAAEWDRVFEEQQRGIAVCPLHDTSVGTVCVCWATKGVLR